jgi:hypothetical protein
MEFGPSEKDITAQQNVLKEFNKPDSTIRATEGERQTPNFWGTLRHLVEKTVQGKEKITQEELIDVASFQAGIDRQGIDTYQNIETTNDTTVPALTVRINQETLKDGLFAYALEGKNPQPSPDQGDRKPPAKVIVIQSGMSQNPSGHAFTGADGGLPTAAEAARTYAEQVEAAQKDGTPLPGEIIIHYVGAPQGEFATISQKFLDKYRAAPTLPAGFKEAYGKTYAEANMKLIQADGIDENTEIEFIANSQGAGITRAMAHYLPEEVAKQTTLMLDIPAGGHESTGIKSIIKGLQTAIGFGINIATLSKENPGRLSALAAGDPILFQILQEKHGFTPDTAEQKKMKKDLMLLDMRALFRGVGTVKEAMDDIPHVKAVHIRYGENDPTTTAPTEDTVTQGNLTISKMKGKRHDFPYDQWRKLTDTLKQTKDIVARFRPAA